MVTQPSTCLRLSDNTAGAITWWRRLPEKFCRNPIVLHTNTIIRMAPSRAADVAKLLLLNKSRLTHTSTHAECFQGLSRLPPNRNLKTLPNPNQPITTNEIWIRPTQKSKLLSSVAYVPVPHPRIL